MKKLDEYISVTNVFTEKQCTDIISHIKEDKNWQQHKWYQFSHDNSYTYKDKELDVLSINNKLSQIINPVIHKSLVNYSQMFGEEGENTTNFLNYFTPPRFNRYTTGTMMRKHVDLIQSIFDGTRKGVPIVSIVIALNDDYEGGEFIFEDDYKIKLKAGDMLIFPSTFMYGHEVTEITKGTRYSLVSWSY